MKNSIKLLIGILLLSVSLFACNRSEKLDEQKDYILIKAIKSAKNQSIENIDIDDLENYASICEEKGEKGKYCLTNALMGYKLYFQCDFDKSMVHLKKAEAKLKYCDSISSFVYSYISNNASTIDTTLALTYIDKAINECIKCNDLKRLPYLYLNKSFLLKEDSAKLYLQKSIELFNEREIYIAKCRYASKQYNSMEPDSVITYIKPCYDSIKFTGYAAVLAEAYLRKGDVDSAYIYIDKIKTREELKELFYKYNSELAALRGKYKEAYEWREKAHRQLSEDYKFMMNQRLGAINAEYDLLNAELQNEKKRVRTMRMYNIGLMVLVALLGVAIILIKRYKRDINELEIDIAKRKERFNTLFEKHKSDYVLDKNSAMTEAMRNLEKLHEAYPSLTRTEITIIWLVFMKCTSERICELLSITQNYYYQRKSAIYRTLGKSGKEACDETLEKIVKEYITI